MADKLTETEPILHTAEAAAIATVDLEETFVAGMFHIIEPAHCVTKADKEGCRRVTLFPSPPK
jgi:hypothetical protein